MNEQDNSGNQELQSLEHEPQANPSLQNQPPVDAALGQTMPNVERTEPQLEYVGFWHRAGARIIDIFYYYFTAIVVGIGLGIIFMVLDQANGTNYISRLQVNAEPAFFLMDIVIGVVCGTLFHSILEGTHGASLGKLITGLVVLRESGEACDFGSAFKRSLAFYVDSLFFGAIGAAVMSDSPEKKRLGDKWGKTVVVRRRSAPKSSLRSGMQFLLSFLGASAVFVVGIVLLTFVRL